MKLKNDRAWVKVNNRVKIIIATIAFSAGIVLSAIVTFLFDPATKQFVAQIIDASVAIQGSESSFRAEPVDPCAQCYQGEEFYEAMKRGVGKHMKGEGK